MSTPLRIGRLAVALAALMLVAIGTIVEAPAAAPAAQGSRSQADRATQMLFEAVHSNDFASAEAAVAAGATIEARDRWNITPIELAIDKGYFRIAHFLVSVRNNHRQAAEATSTARPVESKPTAALSAAPPRADAPTPATAAAEVPVPAWPSDRPNPFDPSAPAFGTGLPVVSRAGDGFTGAAQAPDTGPILAIDTPASAANQRLR